MEAEHGAHEACVHVWEWLKESDRQLIEARQRLEEAVREEREAIAAWLDSLAPGFQCLDHTKHDGWSPECLAAAIRARQP
jgi:hypothetical protein